MKTSNLVDYKINLFTPFHKRGLELQNRIVMAPLTRMRAGEGNVPTALNAEYYAQRASAGLIIGEAAQVSPQGLGYPHTPGIHSPEQVEGWKRVTKAVHDNGGRIFLQLWHVGRISHPSLQPDGLLPVAPSAVAARGDATTMSGPRPFPTPRALLKGEIPGLVEQYRTAALNALTAGFDGVEIHAANGYLLDQFLRDGTNKRHDDYGGNVKNRTRLLFEVIEAVIELWGPDRVGVRLSPSGTFNDVSDSDPRHTFGYVAAELNVYDLAYLHLVNALEQDLGHGGEVVPPSYLREIYKGTLMLNGGYDKERAAEAIRTGSADLIAFGKLFIANPDLPLRFCLDAPLNAADSSTFYGGRAEGYVDYPFLKLDAFAAQSKTLVRCRRQNKSHEYAAKAYAK